MLIFALFRKLKKKQLLNPISDALFILLNHVQIKKVLIFELHRILYFILILERERGVLTFDLRFLTAHSHSTGAFTDRKSYIIVRLNTERAFL